MNLRLSEQLRGNERTIKQTSKEQRRASEQTWTYCRKERTREYEYYVKSPEKSHVHDSMSVKWMDEQKSQLNHWQRHYDLQIKATDSHNVLDIKTSDEWKNWHFQAFSTGLFIQGLSAKSRLCSFLFSFLFISQTSEIWIWHINQKAFFFCT